MTWVPKQSAIISAEISPVWAPEAFSWQSCAPICSGLSSQSAVAT